MKKTHWWALGGIVAGYIIGKAGGVGNALHKF